MLLALATNGELHTENAIRYLLEEGMERLKDRDWYIDLEQVIGGSDLRSAGGLRIRICDFIRRNFSPTWADKASKACWKGAGDQHVAAHCYRNADP